VQHQTPTQALSQPIRSLIAQIRHKPLDPPSRWTARRLLLATALGLTLITVSLGVLIIIVATNSRESADSPPRPGASIAGTNLCMEVTARDIRVFASSHGQDTQAVWNWGTKFWAAPPTDKTPTRHRTALNNGQSGWVTANPQYVTESTDCL
jgi:hypothetical protein